MNSKVWSPEGPGNKDHLLCVEKDQNLALGVGVEGREVGMEGRRGGGLEGRRLGGAELGGAEGRRGGGMEASGPQHSWRLMPEGG